jgi:hypothetical protein
VEDPTPRVGMIVVYFLDAKRSHAAKITHVIDDERVVLQYQTRRRHRYDSAPAIATFATTNRPANSWDFIR